MVTATTDVLVSVSICTTITSVVAPRGRMTEVFPQRRRRNHAQMATPRSNDQRTDRGQIRARRNERGRDARRVREHRAAVGEEAADEHEHGPREREPNVARRPRRRIGALPGRERVARGRRP